jgi:hypothetical protein
VANQREETLWQQISKTRIPVEEAVGFRVDKEAADSNRAVVKAVVKAEKGAVVIRDHLKGERLVAKAVGRGTARDGLIK